MAGTVANHVLSLQLQHRGAEGERNFGGTVGKVPAVGHFCGALVPIPSAALARIFVNL